MEFWEDDFQGTKIHRQEFRGQVAGVFFGYGKNQVLSSGGEFWNLIESDSIPSSNHKQKLNQEMHKNIRKKNACLVLRLNQLLLLAA